MHAKLDAYLMFNRKKWSKKDLINHSVTVCDYHITVLTAGGHNIPRRYQNPRDIHPAIHRVMLSARQQRKKPHLTKLPLSP